LRLDKERDVRTDSADSLSGKEAATVRLVAVAYDVSLSSFLYCGQIKNESHPAVWAINCRVA